MKNFRIFSMQEKRIIPQLHTLLRGLFVILSDAFYRLLSGTISFTSIRMILQWSSSRQLFLKVFNSHLFAADFFFFWYIKVNKCSLIQRFKSCVVILPREDKAIISSNGYIRQSKRLNLVIRFILDFSQDLCR